MMAALEITVKQVEREDRDWKALFKDFYAGRPVKRLGANRHAYFAAYAGEELAGHSVIYLEKGRWVMDGLLVKPEFREMGIAKRLTEARLRYAVGLGADEVWYACDDGNLVTICCHLRFGFEKVCPEGHHCNAATAHWYRLRLTPALKAKLLK
ncbi:MAG: GNAT family N-acetyltransferase [Elusimicrobia bacterium]|nr:GNAT family N-acetyltransferase [Elusimicrobiota bacterium]